MKSRRELAALATAVDVAPAPAVGARIRVERERRGLTLAELGSRVGMVRSGVSMIETGARGLSVEALRDFARALGVSVLELLTTREAVEHADVLRLVQQAYQSFVDAVNFAPPNLVEVAGLEDRSRMPPVARKVLARIDSYNATVAEIRARMVADGEVAGLLGNVTAEREAEHVRVWAERFESVPEQGRRLLAHAEREGWGDDHPQVRRWREVFPELLVPLKDRREFASVNRFEFVMLQSPSDELVVLRDVRDGTLLTAERVAADR